MEPVRLNISRWHDDGMNIRTTCVMHVNTPYERLAWFDRLLAPYWKGLIQVKPLLTGPFPIKNIPQAFETANRPDAIKVLIRD
jgi:L-iditol 2-dehydrogenase